MLNYGMGYNLQRFSPLRRSTSRLCGDLVPVWNYSYDDNRAEESQPLVYKGVLYVSDQLGDHGDRREVRPSDLEAKIEYPPETPRIVCCGIISRGVALYDGKVFRTTLDANVIALDRRPGKKSGGQRSLTGMTATRRRWRR